MKIDRFEDLSAWQEARSLVKMIYRVTLGSAFNADRDLMRQIRRAAVSVMANIAEGFSRYSFKDSRQFFVTARASLAELRSHMYVALDLLYVVEGEMKIVQDQIEVTGKLLSGLIRNTQRQLEVVEANGAIEQLSH